MTPIKDEQLKAYIRQISKNVWVLAGPGTERFANKQYSSRRAANDDLTTVQLAQFGSEDAFLNLLKK